MDKWSICCCAFLFLFVCSTLSLNRFFLLPFCVFRQKQIEHGKNNITNSTKLRNKNSALRGSSIPWRSYQATKAHQACFLTTYVRRPMDAKWSKVTSPVPSSVRSLLVAMPGAPSSFLLLVVRPGAPSSVLVPSIPSSLSRVGERMASHFFRQHL